MSDRFPGGVISKTPPSVSGPAPGTGGSASGVWTLDEVLGYVKAGTWPGEALPFNFALYTWGENSSGELGLTSTSDRSSPVQVGALTDWEQVSTGTDFTACVKTNGTLFTWGNNGFGKLGLNIAYTINRSSPVQVGALTNWAQVSAGLTHAACVKADGTLWTWGNNFAGALGINGAGNIRRSSPVQVGALTDWAQVSVAPQYRTACVKTDGTLWTWGRNFNGELGQNDRIDRSSPVQVGVLTDWAQVEAGFSQMACVKTDGTLWTWGLNNYGQLGQNNTINRSSPVQVGALTNWAQVALGRAHAACVKTDGTLFTWGYNGGGRLGDGTVLRRSSPVQVGALTNWAKVAAGYAHTACVKTDGTLFTWGFNHLGQLGQNNTISRSSPVQVGALTSWAQPAAGGVYSSQSTTACTQVG